MGDNDRRPGRGRPAEPFIGLPARSPATSGTRQPDPVYAIANVDGCAGWIDANREQ